MDGSLFRRLFRDIFTGAVIWLVGCSGLEPRPEPLPYSLYDSPLIAGSPSDQEISRVDRSPEHAEREDGASPERAAESATTPREEEDRPGAPLSTDRSTTDSPGGTKPEEGASDGISPEEAKRRTPASTGGRSESSSESIAHPRAARYVTAIYELNGVDMPETTHRNIPKLYRHCREQNATFQSRKPAAGDLVFFHNVEDANSDGRNNDWYTYVALVEGVDGSGTVTLLGYRGGEVRKFRMNLSNPDDRTSDGGDVVNTELRPEQSDDPPYTQHLAGQLFAGYCALLGDRSELLVVDNWQPGMELQPPE